MSKPPVNQANVHPLQLLPEESVRDGAVRNPVRELPSKPKSSNTCHCVTKFDVHVTYWGIFAGSDCQYERE